MFIGEYNCKIDSKGRITMPAKFREQLNKPFYITRGLENCIDLYPYDEWEKKMEKVNSLPDTNKGARAYKRFLISAAAEVECDAQGRINIPQALVEHASINKELVVGGNGNKIEIWAKEKWTAYIQENNENIDDLVEDLGI